MTTATDHDWQDLCCPLCGGGDYSLAEDYDGWLATCSRCVNEHGDFPYGCGDTPARAVAEYVSAVLFVMYSPRWLTVDPDKPPVEELPN